MTLAATLPTRKDESFRYADFDALAGVWPIAREDIVVAAGQEDSRQIVELGEGAVARHLAIRVEKGAKLDLRILTAGPAYGRIAVDVELAEGADFLLGAAQLATGTYLGRIAVARGADGTDAEQSVRAMLIDRTATANARPELEIYADDVKAAHGCAVGELDAQGLFYLASRGLTPPQAKRLMLQAFVAEAFTGAPDEEALSEAALARLEAIL